MKPSFQSVVEKQRIAAHWLAHGKATRSEPEIAHYRRVVQPIPLADVALPQLPLVRSVGGNEQFILLGELAQRPGVVVLLALADSRIDLSHTSATMELVPDENT